MRHLFISLFLITAVSCSTVTRQVIITHKVNEYYYEGYYGMYNGVWEVFPESTDSSGTGPYYHFVFARPDSILVVGDDYVLAVREKKYCLMYKDETGKRTYLKSKNKSKIDELLKRLY